MKKKILVWSMVVALVAVLVMPMAVLAANTGTQNASTSQSTSLEIVADDGSSAVSQITFPVGAPGAEVENPYNNIDGAGALEQTYHLTASIPVVTIKNATGGALTVTLTVGAWSEAVASERYLLVQNEDATVEAGDVTAALTGTVATGIAIANGDVGDLYLEVTLSALYGEAGTSSLTVLGES